MGEHPNGVGRWGHHDLAGNVWEYVLDGCTDLCDDYQGMGGLLEDPAVPTDITNLPNGILRGGAYLARYTAPFARTAYRQWIGREPTAPRNSNTGFRCARERM